MGQADPHRQKADGRFSCGGLPRSKGCHAFGKYLDGRKAMTLFLLASRQEKIE